MVDVGDDGDVAKFHEELGFTGGGRPDGAKRAVAVLLNAEDDGDPTARRAKPRLSRLIVRRNTRKIGEREEAAFEDGS